MKPDKPQDVKLIIGFLYHELAAYQQAEELCREKWGSVDYHSKEYFFDMTSYYNEEMGMPIFRCFNSYQKLIDPSRLAEIKLQSNEIEDALTVTGKRRVNLDPGYLDYDKLVLASAKYNYQKIYLGEGIYADPTLFYRKGRFQAPEWAFPDFKAELYENDFLHIRFIYKKQLL
ncbi:MAG: DUF4416 family protein [Candidatus Cloacimonetes bacterium]|nr:DUF4416 family protein [Candidatus Cloacimonadota bacterium]